MAVLKKESKKTAVHAKNTEEMGEKKTCAHVSISQILSKKYASGKGNLMSNKLRQILLNLLMRQSKEKRLLFNQR